MKLRIIVIVILCGLLVNCTGEKIPAPQKESVTEVKVEPVPKALQSATWIKHLKKDILPFWTTPEAKGDPQGNYPTFRRMDGKLPEAETQDKDKDPTVRYPRMLARQVYLYSMAYMITGETHLVQLAKDGCDHLSRYAWDEANGGWYARMEKNGAPIGEETKYAQDTAYVALAFAAYYFITRDPEIEKHLLATRDLIFSKYWDIKNKRVYDGLSFDMKTEYDQWQDNGWELVAQLDQINAYLLLAQPVLSDKTRQVQFLSDMNTLAHTMIKYFLQDGIFWGIHTKKGEYDTRHVDFGHTLKTYWMLYLLDQRLPDNPYAKLVEDNVHKWLELAYDKENGTWGEKMLMDESGKLYAKYGSSWWIYAEADQLAATLNFRDQRYREIIKKTAKNWLDYFVDNQYKEVYSDIKRDGAKGWDWTVDSTAKCFQWKNGFHSVEHALVMAIHGKVREGNPVELYFAVPTGTEDKFIARPYIFEGKEIDREMRGEMEVDKQTLKKVKVKFRM